jgi:sterol desaturase/sphingolipid hydroxylase (fatty acid hydroxylase superfamily)
MQLSKASYYSDFVVYPVAVIALTGINFSHLTWLSGREWLGAVIAGMVGWTLLEYFIHRFALHWSAYFSPMHALHHGAPVDYIGTPSWISVTVWSGAVLLPAWYLAGFNFADGLTVGIMIGYWWYGTVHHVIHHHADRPTSPYFKELRAWHMRHHHSPKQGNFGVTLPLWDYVFRTAIRNRGKAVISS